MSSYTVFFGFLFILCHITFSFAAESSAPPSFYIDKGPCPFECCTYRNWKAEKATVIRERPDKNSKIIAGIKRGSIVKGLTGEVHVQPSRFVIKKQTEKYKPGDVVWVYTYLGEGHFKVWFGGEMYEDDLGFSPYGGTAGTRCARDNQCIGELEKELKFTWWVQVQTETGDVGWSDEPDNFGNKDACG